MTPREERGLVIAAMCKLNRNSEDEWLVPSQSTTDIYKVNPVAKTCTCPDHAENGHHCKHLYAVEITMKREFLPDGTVVETKSVTFTERKTYKQNWPAYNHAQSIEKDRFQELLGDLLQGIEEPPAPKTGRKPRSYKDCLFAMVFKVYSTISSRRFSSDLREAHSRGYLSAPVPGMKVNSMLENAAFTPILKSLISKSALPL